MQIAYCRWHNKKMEDVTEHEQEQCEESGQNCKGCPDLTLKECDEEEL